MRRMNEQEDKYEVDSDWVMPQITDLVPDGGSLDQQSEQQRVHLRGLDGQRAASRSRDSCVPQEVTVLLTQPTWVKRRNRAARSRRPGPNSLKISLQRSLQSSTHA